MFLHTHEWQTHILVIYMVRLLTFVAHLSSHCENLAEALVQCCLDQPRHS